MVTALLAASLIGSQRIARAEIDPATPCWHGAAPAPASSDSADGEHWCEAEPGSRRGDDHGFGAPIYGHDALLSRLRSTGELITRHTARRAALRGSVRALSHEIVGLRQRADDAGRAIAEQRDAARSREQALDRIVPRLVVRARVMAQRHGQAARALADLASLDRRRELDPELRLRLDAIGPALAALLRAGDGAQAALTRQYDRASQRQGELALRLPALRSEKAAAERRRLDLIARRTSARAQIAGLDALVGRLARTRAPLVQEMAVIGAAHLAWAAPGAAEPANPAGAPGAGMAGAMASVRGHVRFAPEVAGISSLGTAKVSMAAVVRERRVPRPRLEPQLAVRLAALPSARPRTPGRAGAAPAGIAGTAVAAVAAPASSGRAVVALSSRVAGRLARPEPIRPAVAVAMATFGGGGQAGVTIAAEPGQPVAAPQDGRIVFADAFKGYGLLLIIEHHSEYHTLLWGFSKLRVGVGDEVTGGEIIGVMDVVDGVRPRLGVEIRRRGRLVNPLPWLAASNSKVRG